MLSEVVWLVIAGVALTWELLGVFTYHRTGIEPLTYLTRDRLMRGNRFWWYAFLLAYVWLGCHFFLEAPAPWELKP